LPEETPELFRVVRVNVNVNLLAPPARVWQALTQETVRWWPKSFYMGAQPRAFVLEPTVGGRVYEDWGNGEGLLWYRVTAVRSPELLQLEGQLGPEHGPASLSTALRLRPRGLGTRLSLVETAWGQLAHGIEGQLEDGWTQLLDGCLRPYIKDGTQPERPTTLDPTD
jgi:uncharacterized protein YndB with AHSA1/START domain